MRPVTGTMGSVLDRVGRWVLDVVNSDLGAALAVPVRFDDVRIETDPSAVVEMPAVAVDMVIEGAFRGDMRFVLARDQAVAMAGPPWDAAAGDGEVSDPAFVDVATAAARTLATLVGSLGRSTGIAFSVGDSRAGILSETSDPLDEGKWEGVVGLDLVTGIENRGRLLWFLDRDAVEGLSRAVESTSDAAAGSGGIDRGISSAVLGALSEVELEVAAELGKTRVKVRDLLGLQEGSVLRLPRSVGETVDLLVNGRPAARGDVVVVNGRFGVRIREVVGRLDDKGV